MLDCTTIGGFPSKVVNILVQEDCSPYHAVIIQTKIDKPLSIVINAATAMLSHGVFTGAVVRTDFSIDISHYRKNIMLRDTRYFILELFIPVIFNVVLSLVGRGITLNDSKA